MLAECARRLIVLGLKISINLAQFNHDVGAEFAVLDAELLDAFAAVLLILSHAILLVLKDSLRLHGFLQSHL